MSKMLEMKENEPSITSHLVLKNNGNDVCVCTYLTINEMEENKDDLHNRHQVDSLPELQYSNDSSSTMKTLAGVAGNVLEWYDFACFGYFSDILADQFFPKQAGDSALLESFVVFGGAFLMRPIGGIVMGMIGDRFGSQRALEVSVFLMAFPTFAMGCLPTYSQVGIISPILLVIVRLLQGFSVGGQLTSSLVFTVENHPRHQWGFYGSLVMATANIGTLLGGVMGYVMRRLLTHNQLESWGWRIPFLSGVFVSISGFYLRSHSNNIHEEAPPGSNPFRDSIAPKNRKALLSSSLVPMLWSCGFYVSFVWMAIFMNDLVDPPVPYAFGLNALALFITQVVLFPLSGMLVDKFGTTPIMRIGGALMIMFGPIAVSIISKGQAIQAFIAQCILGLILSLWGGPMMAWLVESFPAKIRLTSVSIGYNIAQATVGGMSPGLATYLVDRVGLNSPGYLLSFIGIIAMIGLHIAPPHSAYRHSDYNK